jgi:hypothetical protein
VHRPEPHVAVHLASLTTQTLPRPRRDVPRQANSLLFSFKSLLMIIYFFKKHDNFLKP